MCLLINVFASVISILVWYCSANAREMKIITLVYLYGGASLMWLMDSVAEYLDAGTEIFNPEPLVLLNDLFLGLSVVALGLVIWVIVLLIYDPKGVIRKNNMREEKVNEK